MTETDYAVKLDEIERLLNDPDRRMDAMRVWALLEEVASHHAMIAIEPRRSRVPHAKG